VSWRSGFLAGAAAAGALAAISVASLVIGVVETGGTTQFAGASVLTAGPATIIAAGPATAVTYRVSSADQRRALDYWTTRRMLIAASSTLPRALARTELAPATLSLTAQVQAQLARAVRVPHAPPAPKGAPSATSFDGSRTAETTSHSSRQNKTFQ